MSEVFKQKKYPLERGDCGVLVRLFTTEPVSYL